jgi:hypothetical protein
MPKADELHYRLLKTALEHYAHAETLTLASSHPMKETARRSIATVREAAERAGDEELLDLCGFAEKVVKIRTT